MKSSRKRINRLVKRDGILCWICGEPVELNQRGTGCGPQHPLGPTADHVVPRSRGGNDLLENLRLAHYKCNTRRGNDDGASTDAAARRRAERRAQHEYNEQQRLAKRQSS